MRKNKIKNKYFIPSLAIILLFMICNYPDNGIEKYNRFYDCPGYSIKDTLGLIDKYLYPSDLDQLNAYNIMARCYEGTKIDSSWELFEKTTLHTYTLSNKGSEMNIIHYKSNDGKCGFIIRTYFLTSNIFKIENGISIGMTKEDFLKKVKVKNVDCEAFRVYLGDNSIYYYTFFFKHDRLKSIAMDIPSM